MTKHEKARRWRTRLKFSRRELAEKIGYSVESIYWFEEGINPPRGKARSQDPIQDWVWQRYRLACAGYEAETAKGKKFDW